MLRRAANRVEDSPPDLAKLASIADWSGNKWRHSRKGPDQLQCNCQTKVNSIQYSTLDTSIGLLRLHDGI
jgi:hypothetical protein